MTSCHALPWMVAISASRLPASGLLASRVSPRTRTPSGVAN